MKPPVWLDDHIYAAPDSPAIDADFQRAREALKRLPPLLDELTKTNDINALRHLLRAIRACWREVRLLEWNCQTYGYNRLSRDGRDEAARVLLSRGQQLQASLAQLCKPVTLFWVCAPEEQVRALLQDPELFELAYAIRHDRRQQDQWLSLESEQLIAGLSVDGLQGWGDLYDNLVGRLRPVVEGQPMGLAQADNLLAHPQRARRAAAWHAIQAAWGAEQETVAAILNAINGWRNELTRQRGRERRWDALDVSCHQGHLERVTLETLMAAAGEHKALGRRALRAMACAQQISDFAPWDLYAPAPAAASVLISFEQALALVADAFAGFDPEMGAFARMMAANGWIDAAPSEHRRSGAYSTEYADPPEPRVFLTFEGTLDNVITLAHELGHAWHSWLLRELPLEQRDYPKTLAETASLFAEALVRDALLAATDNMEQRRAIAWLDGERAASLLLDVPARFTFERALVAAREEGYVGAGQLRHMMKSAQQQWYGDTLSQYDELFWARKGHFSIAELGFYNYPYLFGYLFSLGLYAQQARAGREFVHAYRELLRDTGRMSAEELVEKHLGVDIREPAFWQESLDYVEEAVARLERLV
ncbi:M3 family oligoendopeptidase [Aeromonas hydrophila]|uniref:M3 family oligoendopeptidase n=1 Tax=Aeromonas hydrophila TaxID=644 RepID=UPI000332AC8F|nr:M3 family oligoendopeptidase [Aeromonas hydrophila]AGM44520.1 oligoendopeptidase F [Aeromonas hydrophila ML09-119]AHX33186.1 peptidase M3 [Aeromonas hydrophila subsp. hydrophila AL09-71]AHX69986.1 peptidase M3 [Aeromonas hydrophila pc104A]AJE35988.1 peptidase M3 [Aeromonas hydrophila J-1]AKJ34244.1 peptidase M3 [Aeromonas hydrophila NJ-35]